MTTLVSDVATSYLTLRELDGVGSLSQFEKYAGPLLRGQLSAGKGVGGIGDGIGLCRRQRVGITVSNRNVNVLAISLPPRAVAAA